ncbi:NnrS family protein [Aliiruegeria sabulilitoris]|uniref:NnrS family protein n=1 Tax=Aliiruegeria sabulilitoris TaxID=1510458 RepID=UPI0008353A61|nr:NnrS family protein [Aliiruegeria sabulilitoris]NDR58142.1 NnrS family protein [Pseudoruegeria sp. M32A2M]
MTPRMNIFFSEGFRVFFLSAGLYAVFAGVIWVIWLTDPFPGGVLGAPQFAVPPQQWHAHEMIFGYASTALGGFLLTAVPNWTGTQAARHLFVILTASIWLAGRVAVWFAMVLPAGLVALLDLAFLPILIVKIAQQLMKRPKPQNVLFVLFLSIVWAGNLMVHLEWMGITADTLDSGMRVGLLGLCSMIGVLGGRVTPGFTRNAMKRADLPEQAWPRSTERLDKAGLALAVILPLALLIGVPAVPVGGLAILSGGVQLVRLSRWSGRWTLNQPILLALHLGMAMLGLGLVLWGLAWIGFGDEVAALHLLGIGAVGGMTLAVMSRAVLGHTGRELIAPGPVAASYLIIAASAVLRWIGSELSGDWYSPLVVGSGLCWVLAFALYTVSVLPLVTTPRLPRAG